MLVVTGREWVRLTVGAKYELLGEELEYRGQTAEELHSFRSGTRAMELPNGYVAALVEKDELKVLA